jgi:hypothetical protein
VPDYIAASANVQAEGSFDAKKLSSKDQEALNAFLPEYLKTEAMSAIVLNASTQVESLKELSTELETEIASSHAESKTNPLPESRLL